MLGLPLHRVADALANASMPLGDQRSGQDGALLTAAAAGDRGGPGAPQEEDDDDDHDDGSEGRAFFGAFSAKQRPQRSRSSPDRPHQGRQGGRRRSLLVFGKFREASVDEAWAERCAASAVPTALQGFG